MSQPFLKAVLEGRLREEIETVATEVKVAMFLTGSRTVQDLASAPRVYGPRLRNWIEQRRLHC
jgi:L-lactate dehydrogenase (FMN-dependent) and related alpha-hydroxy acid dehydrogenases